MSSVHVKYDPQEYLDYLEEIRQPTLEDQEITLRACKRGSYDVFNAMLLFDVTDAGVFNRLQRLRQRHRYHEAKAEHRRAMAFYGLSIAYLFV